MSTAFGTKVPGQLITSAWANQVGSAINALEDGNALTLAQILAKFTGTPSVGKFLDYTGAWNTPPLTTDASALTSGTLPLARLSGITTSQLSASAGIVSGQIAGVALDKLTAGTLATTLALGSQAINQTGATIFTLANAGGLYLHSNVGTAGYQFYVQASDGTVRIGKTGAGNTLYNGSHTVSHFCKTNGGHYFYDNSSTLIGYFQADGSAMMGRQNVTSITTLTNYTKIHFSSTEKYRFASALCEFDRLSLGGTIGSSVNPGAGGIALTGCMVFAGAGTVSSTTTQIFSTGSNQNLIFNVPSTYAHYMRVANVDIITGGYSFWGGTGAQEFGIGWWGTGGDGTSYSTRSGIRSSGNSYISHNANVAHLLGIGGTTQFTIDASNCTAAGGLVASKFGLGVTPVAQQTGGALTAAGTYGANEQSMIQKAYDCLRSFGFLS